MSMHNYCITIALSLLSAHVVACQHTVKKLNTMFLMPLTAQQAEGLKSMTLGTLFTEINKRGVPTQGTVEIKTTPESSFWHFEKGLPKNITEPIFIHSCPRDGTLQRIFSGQAGHSLLCCNQWLKNYIINSPLITFDHQFDIKHFDFGAGNSIINFNKIYTETIAANPQADIAIAGTCIGAKIALEFLAAHPCSQVKAAILESPFVDFEKVMKNWHKRYVPLVPFGATLIQGVFKGLFPKIRTIPNTLSARLANIPKNIPLFIAHLYNDSFISNTDMLQIINTITASGSTDVYLLVIKDSTRNHGHLNSKKIFAQATNAFLAAYGLPHNAALAEEGKEILAAAKDNAYAKAEKDWTVFEEAKTV